MSIEEEFLEVRTNPLLWFESFAKVKELATQVPITPTAKPVQRRLFEYYSHCQEREIPCRTITVKGRRAGGSDGHAALMYLHAQNHLAECGQIGTDYRTSKNMLAKVQFFGEHDEFPGWTESGEKPAAKVSESSVPWEEYYDANALDSVPFDQRTSKTIASRIEWPHGSVIQLYSAQRPESARSAGLQCYHGTEVFRWPNGGAMDAGETLNAMNKTVPKRGFNWIGLEGTANGAQGSAYELCRSARWPEHATWWHKWQMVWPQNVAPIGKEIQFVIIFAAWFEDFENQFDCTPEEEKLIRETLDEDEKGLIARYECEGPLGLRLGEEVITTTWNQLKWRRATIRQECNGDADEFKQEFPSDIQEAFRASGSPALDHAGLTALEEMARDRSGRVTPRYGQLTQQSNGSVAWVPVERDQAWVIRWEDLVIPVTSMGRGGRYIIGVDSMSGADQVTGTGKKDRHSVLVLRDAYSDHRGQYHPVRVVARIKPPCQLESEVLAKQIYLLSVYFGGATIVVEASSAGVSILKTLSDEYRANVWQREVFDDVTQRMTKKLGWMQSEPARRIIIDTLQKFVREQMLELFDLWVLGELLTLIINAKGKAVASGSNFDDDAIALGLALECLPAAHEYPAPQAVRRVDLNEIEWKRVGR